MEDSKIIEMFEQREEAAIAEVTKKYQNYCKYIAGNILKNSEDVEECLNDVWLKLWNCIPPQKPENLRVFLGCMIRNRSINLYNRKKAKKRFANTEVLLSELEECLSAGNTVEHEVENQRIGSVISQWLGQLEENDQIVFVRRYWYGVPVKELARLHGCTPNAMTSRLKRLRLQLKEYLDREDVLL